mmetsp:Transcript_44089/g.111118  ORF Transcript_44089/g.111118 Transcript_44089/m.111118 type:complete len:294 (+) Transcript_44089:87-968(+)|eukprot:CAMPEP_0177631968 /NCGR_PEP_ID=MMETSP0447-20121125/2034_1 /TAXON_ID=0 /ORGANISM="Stygamoeba regulata, Strain BSH-02190019" /LENGTH=293 /DNA_ID=CAMNT_0019133491 /DNA_START=63 /DNA_END=944 /DNA_ORIENTATION=-
MDIRSKQIHSLATYFPSAKALSAEHYQIPFSAHGSSFYLNVFVGGRFPYEPPHLQLQPPCAHEHLDERCAVRPAASAGLSSWSVHTDLGMTVYEVIQMFSTRPPRIGGVASGSSDSVRQSVDGAHTSIPAVPATFAEVSSLSENDIDNLLRDPSQFETFFSKLECVRAMQSICDELRDSNEKQAKEHLAMESEISSLRDQITAKERELAEARREFDIKAEKQKALMQRYTPQALASELDRLANEADSQSETLVNDFLGSAPGSADTGEFSKQYLELRKRYHTCNAKREVLLHQ